MLFTTIIQFFPSSKNILKNVVFFSSKYLFMVVAIPEMVVATPATVIVMPDTG